MAKRIVIGKGGEVIETELPRADFSEMESAISLGMALYFGPEKSAPAPAPEPVAPAPYTGVYL